jgi:prepilin-type N-terminal cleavage/methylation domain-containing protein
MKNAIARLRAHRQSEDGFTLIELLIVIIVLGILAAIVVFAVGSTRGDSVSASCRTDAKAIELSLEGQNTSQATYPVGTVGIDGTVTAVPSPLSPAPGALLKAWPNVNSGDATFAYSGTATTYTVTIGGTHVVHGSFSNSSDTGVTAACTAA